MSDYEQTGISKLLPNFLSRRNSQSQRSSEHSIEGQRLESSRWRIDEKWSLYSQLGLIAVSVAGLSWVLAGNSVSQKMITRGQLFQICHTRLISSFGALSGSSYRSKSLTPQYLKKTADCIQKVRTENEAMSLKSSLAFRDLLADGDALLASIKSTLKTFRDKKKFYKKSLFSKYNRYIGKHYNFSKAERNLVQKSFGQTDWALIGTGASLVCLFCFSIAGIRRQKNQRKALSKIQSELSYLNTKADVDLNHYTNILSDLGRVLNLGGLFLTVKNMAKSVFNNDTELYLDEDTIQIQNEEKSQNIQSQLVSKSKTSSEEERIRDSSDRLDVYLENRSSDFLTSDENTVQLDSIPTLNQSDSEILSSLKEESPSTRTDIFLGNETATSTINFEKSVSAEVIVSLVNHKYKASGRKARIVLDSDFFDFEVKEVSDELVQIFYVILAMSQKKGVQEHPVVVTDSVKENLLILNFTIENFQFSEKELDYILFNDTKLLSQVDSNIAVIKEVCSEIKANVFIQNEFGKNKATIDLMLDRDSYVVKRSLKNFKRGSKKEILQQLNKESTV